MRLENSYTLSKKSSRLIFKNLLHRLDQRTKKKITANSRGLTKKIKRLIPIFTKKKNVYFDKQNQVKHPKQSNTSKLKIRIQKHKKKLLLRFLAQKRRRSHLFKFAATQPTRHKVRKTISLEKKKSLLFNNLLLWRRGVEKKAQLKKVSDSYKKVNRF